jgi:hypothetical protein
MVSQEMIDHLTTPVVMALVAVGAYVVQQEGMVLGRLPDLWKRLPPFWQKPFWTCPPCMCSVWGIPAWLLVTDHRWALLPVDLLMAAGIAYIIANKTNL